MVALLAIVSVGTDIPSEHTPPTDTPMRVHRSDYYGYDAATGEHVIRCQLCGGTKQHIYFVNGRVAGNVPCDLCDPAGRDRTKASVVIVQDSERTIYDEWSFAHP